MEDSQLHIHTLVQERTESISKVGSFVQRLVNEDAKGPSRADGAGKRKFAGVEAMATGLEPRRRTTSFRPYKIPRALKEKRREKKIRGKVVQFNRRCRKHRRRPHILLSKNAEFTSGSRWLESHVWHRKRMFMDKRWGTWLGDYNRGRGMGRKLASTLSTRCVMHDSSYLVPLKASGKRSLLESLLRHFIDPAEPLFSSQSEADSSGDALREIDLLVYHKDSFPQRRLGPLSMTILKSDPDQWIVLLWLHPAISSDLGRAVDETATEMSGGEDIIRVQRLQSGPCRFSLRGHGLIPLLDHFLLRTEESKGEVDKQDDLLGELARCSPRAVHRVWPLGHCLGLQMASLGASIFRVASEWPERCCSKRRLQWGPNNVGREYVPRVTVQDDSHLSENGLLQAPIVLIRKDEGKSSGHLTNVHVIKKTQRVEGVDILLPTAIAKSLWCRLSLQGAEVCPLGYEEMSYLRLCGVIPSFPRDYPETAAGEAYWAHKALQEEAANALLPPRKRKIPPIYIHKRRHIFADTEAGGYLVVREGRYLTAFEQASGGAAASADEDNAMDKESESSDSDDSEEEDEATSVPVLIKAVSRGVPEQGASLFLPIPADLEQYVYHLENKCFVDTSTGKRVGMWQGVAADHQSTGDGSSVVAVTRTEVGCVTSGVNRSKGGGRKNRGRVLFVPGHHAIGLISAEGLQSAQKTCAASPSMKEGIVLFKNPGSAMMHPARLHLIHGA